MKRVFGFSKLGMALVAVVFLLAAVGCSSSDVIGPNANPSVDNGSLARVGVDGARSFSFKYAGQVSKFDIDQRVIELGGGDFSSSSVTVFVGKETSLRTAPGRAPIPFDFKYIEVGTNAIVLGEQRADGIVDAGLIELNYGQGSLDENPDVVLAENPFVGETFKYFGEVFKFDPDGRMVEFVGNALSSQNLQVEIARDADLRFGSSGSEISFDFKYLQVGSFVTVIGVQRSSDRALISTVIIGDAVDGLEGDPGVVFFESGEAQNDFRYYGELDKVDEDARVLKFVGADFSSTPLTTEVAREAELRNRNGGLLPFSFKYIAAGDFVTVSGAKRADGTLVAELVELPQGAPVSSGETAF